MKIEVPSHFVRQYSSKLIAKKVEQLGEEVGTWAQAVSHRTGTDVLAIPVLRGSVFFFCDLARCLGTSVEIAPVRIWAYDPTKNAASDEVKVDLGDVGAERRSILLVDDICDSGRSLSLLHKKFLDVGAHEIKSVVLIRREVKDSPHKPDWVGFEYVGDEWFVGYGMDDCLRWRNLPDIYIIKQTKE